MGNANGPTHQKRQNPVHPHVHGERYPTLQVSDRFIGSSPRTWGTPLDAHKTLGDVRFIPTYMGNAWHEPLQVSASSVHPHVHGERKQF